MKRRAVLVLLLTFVALVVATVWVPITPRASITLIPRLDGGQGYQFDSDHAAPSLEWERVDVVARGQDPWHSYAHGRRTGKRDFAPGEGRKVVVRWGPPRFRPLLFGGIVTAILAVGGLLALALHTRAKRRSVEA